MNNRSHPVKKKHKHRIIRFFFISFLILVLAGIVGLVALFAYYYPKVPTLNTSLFNYSQNAVIVDRFDQPYQNLQGEENRQTLSAEEIPDQVKNSFIAIEDKRFYQHNGVDIKAIGRAAMEVISNQNLNGSGGSTITQQLIKLTHLTSEKTLERKFDEWILALQLEQVYDKSQILTAYLNKVNFHGAEGVQAAAQQYFGKNVTDLDLAQTAVLAAIPNSPTYFDPYTYNETGEIIRDENGNIVLNPNNITRANNVINEMINQGFISAEDGNVAKQELITGTGLTYNNPNRVYSYFTDAVYSQLLQDVMTTLNISQDEAVKTINTSGLTIHSTVDPNVQSVLENASQDESLFPSKSNEAIYATEQTGTDYKPEVAMTVVNNEDGSVVGMVGGRENSASLSLNRATTPFQTGSSTKPITVYAPALNEKITTLSSVYNDQPVNIDGWRPHNSDGQYRGAVTVRNALVNSINTVAVEVEQDLSLEKSIEYGRKLNLTINKDDETFGAMALGGYVTGQSTEQMASAFSTFARNGEYVKPYLYTRVVDAQGNTIISHSPEKATVFSPETSYLITDVLKQACTQGTAKLNIPGTEVAGKTGTTDDLVNAYFCGYSPTYSTAIWYGYDSSSVNVNGKTIPLNIGVTGGAKPGPAGMFENVMNSLETNTTVKNFTQPSNVVRSSENNSSGELYIKGTEPEEKSTSNATNSSSNSKNKNSSSSSSSHSSNSSDSSGQNSNSKNTESENSDSSTNGSNTGTTHNSSNAHSSNASSSSASHSSSDSSNSSQGNSSLTDNVSGSGHNSSNSSSSSNSSHSINSD